MGGARLLTLWHPLLPEFSAALPAGEGLRLRPLPPLPQPLEPGGDPSAAAALLVRVAALASFLKFHGFGIAFEDVARIGSRRGDPWRPQLGAIPVPDWRAASPALVTGAVAVRMGGGTAEGSAADALRESIERALESGGLPSPLAAAAASALQAHTGAGPPERLVGELAGRLRAREALGPDLLGLAFPAAAERDGRDGVPGAEGDAALFVVRGAARRTPGGFVEVPAPDRLEEGSALKLLARRLGGDPRADALAALAAGRAAARWPDGPPIAVVALGADLWDQRSRRALESDLPGAGFTVFETRTRPPRPWERRRGLESSLERADIASLLWLPFRTWRDAAAAWDAVAAAAGGDAARFLRLARSLAACFDPAARRPAGTIRFLPERADPDPILGAAAWLASGFGGPELAAAAGVDLAEAGAAVARGREQGLLVEEGRTGWRYRDEAERERMANSLSAGARRSVADRLGRARIGHERLVVASLARGSEEDIRAAAALLPAAPGRGADRLASDLLSRAPRHAPDLGRPDLAARVFAAGGRMERARAAAARISPAGLRSESLAGRAALARLLARLGQAEKAVALLDGESTVAASLSRAQVLLDLKRTDGAARALAEAGPPSPRWSAGERLSRARLEAEVASRQGDLGRARRLLNEAAASLGEPEDPEEAALLLMTAGWVAVDAGDVGDAFGFFCRAQEMSRDPLRRADAALDAATALIHAGDHAAAEERLSVALALYAEAGDEERYLSALGNRIDLALRAGRYETARETLSVVLAHEAKEGREHQYLFAVTSRQQLARLDGDGESARAAFGDAASRRAAVPSHPAWREILILEAARLLAARQAGEALARLEEAGRLPDNRERTEPLRLRLLLSARGDLGGPTEAEGDALPAGERALLRAEEDLRAGRAPQAEAWKELESLGGSPRGAAALVERLLEWMGRFPGVFALREAHPLLDLGRRAAARAGLFPAGRRFVSARASLAPSAPREEKQPGPPPFVAEDAGTRAALEVVRRTARTRLPILILGETGTGKELLAREVHRLSGRSGRFVPVNVASLTGSLIESELFGHVRGAFTGADRDRKGLVEEASGGTLFLDEIGDLALPLQAKLLRVLQEGELRRVGDTRTRPVDLRVVSATHRDLRAMVDEGSFRRDLLYRLSGAEAELPPLRKRPLDLARLVAGALGASTLTSEARGAVSRYSWPGNVRELQAALEAARALASPSPVVGLEHLPQAVRQAASGPPPSDGSYRKGMAEAKTRMILAALEATGGNRTQAARRLGLSRQALLYEMKVLGLAEPPLDSRRCRSSAASRRSRSSSGGPRRSSSS